MTRLLNAIVYNWPLKLLAIALATLLYGFVVLSENAQTRDVEVQIGSINQPAKTILIGQLGIVTQIRYFTSDQTNVTVTDGNFSANVDLSGIQAGPEPQSLRVVVTSADPRIQVLSATPAFVSVRLESVQTKDVPVVVVPGAVPDGLSIRPPTQSLETATVLGAQTDIDRVTEVRAAVPIDASGLNIDREFPLVPVDQLGDPVRGVDVEPTTVRVTMVVDKNTRTKPVPIAVQFAGNPAPGFEVTRVTVEPQIVSIAGDAADLSEITTVQTEPLSIDGRTSDLDATVAFALPSGVDVVTPKSVQVHVDIRPITESRNFSAGIRITGAAADRTYALSIPQAQLTVGGAPADLDQLSGANLSLVADVTGLPPGIHEVPLTIDLGSRVNVIAISPATVTITIVAAGSPAPSVSGGG